jgi:hypothetical protein
LRVVVVASLNGKEGELTKGVHELSRAAGFWAAMASWLDWTAVMTVERL